MPPPLRIPSIDGLRAFEAAARLGSFERAADELAITASAVSKRVAAVEDLLGTALLSRQARGLQPTAAGKEYLEQVRGALGLLAAMPLHRQAARRVQRLRVSSPPTFARQVLVPRLEGFTLAHPQVELEIVLSIPFLGSAVEADVEIRHGDARAAGVLPLMDDVVLPVAAPALLDRLPPLRRPADLLRAPLLRTPIEPWLPWFRAAGLDAPEPAEGPRLLDLGLTLEAAVSGQGVALARPSLARAWLEAGSLLPPFEVAAQPLAQYHLLPHVQDGASGAFALWLRQACAEAQAAGLRALAARLKR